MVGIRYFYCTCLLMERNIAMLMLLWVDLSVLRHHLLKVVNYAGKIVKW